MSEDRGYTQTVSTAGLAEPPQLILEQPTSDIRVEGWDRQEIEVSISDRDALFDIEQAGSHIRITNRPAGTKLINFLEPAVDDLHSLGVDVGDIAARVEREVGRRASQVERSMRRFNRGFNLQFDMGRWAPGNDYTIRVPHNCNLTLRTSSGDVSVQGVDGTIYMQSTSGDLRLLDSVGNAILQSSSGDITVAGVEGRLGVRSASGDVRAEHCALEEVTANTVSGDLSLDLIHAPQREWEVKTVSGDLQLKLPFDIRVTAEVQTLSGEITCGFSRSQVNYTTRSRRNTTLVINGGGPTLHLATVSGDITLTPGAPEGESRFASAPHVPAPSATNYGQEPQQPPASQQTIRMDSNASNAANPPQEADRTEPEGHVAREQAELEILQAVARGEITAQEGVQRLSQLDGE